jgi:H/ACA ribonucleoprotein complex subunit 4
MKWKDEYKDFSTAQDGSASQASANTAMRDKDPAAPSVPSSAIKPDVDEPKDDEKKKRKRNEGETPDERAERKRKKKEKKEKEEKKEKKEKKERRKSELVKVEDESD